MASYYKKIKGKNHDRALLDLADASTKGKGDGRISINDAKKLFKKIKDSDTYTDIEKRTVQYIRDNYTFTKEADGFFRAEVRKWASGKKESEKKTVVSKKKADVNKKAVKKPAAKKKTTKKPVTKKPAAKKTPVKKPVEKKEEAGFIPSFTEPEIKEREAVQRAAEVPEEKEEGSKKPVAALLIVVVIAALAFFLFPRFKKFLSSEKKVSDRGEVTGKGEEIEVKKTGEIKEQTTGQKSERKERVETDKGRIRPAPVAEEKNIYTVQIKDQLTKISYRFYGNHRDWKIIYNANRDRIKDPALIFPGQKLIIPEKK